MIDYFKDLWFYASGENQKEIHWPVYMSGNARFAREQKRETFCARIIALEWALVVGLVSGLVVLYISS